MNSNLDSKGAADAPLPRPAPLRFFAAQVFTAFYWPLGAVLVLVVSIVPGLFLSRAARQQLGQGLIGRLLGTFMEVVEWLGVIRVSDEELRSHSGVKGPLIIACNHPALWDALLVIRRLVRVSCIMKADLLENPLLRNGALLAGFLPNSPRLKMVRKAVERLQSGGRLLLFPEGTRTRLEQGVINDFKPGLALLAKHSGAPVLPVFISSDSRYLQKGWPICRRPDLPITITVRVGKPEEFQPGETVREFTGRLENVFRRELGGQ